MIKLTVISWKRKKGRTYCVKNKIYIKVQDKFKKFIFRRKMRKGSKRGREDKRKKEKPHRSQSKGLTTSSLLKVPLMSREGLGQEPGARNQEHNLLLPHE